VSASPRTHELAVAVTADGVRVPLSRARAADVVRRVLEAERVRDALLSFTFVTPAAIARMNREHLDHRGPTDVISFGLSQPDGPVVGDVYICPAVARDHAREHGGTLREELARLLIHGTLHVLGYEHAEDEGRTSGAMWTRQEQLLAATRAAWST
jgi:probable rRNA maturation factor